MNAKIFVHKNFPIGDIDKNIFGGFVEHLGRCVYTGVYEPDHPTADADGFRGDVLELVKELNMPLMRYPGGNFVSGYEWKNTVGPERRPQLDYAWRAKEPNAFGIDEFVKWCRKVNSEPLMAVNLGTGTPKSAQELVEYCNFPGGSYWSDKRIANGAKEPHGIKYWCLGNEMDGEWQIGHKTAKEYGRLAKETAKMMKMVDQNIKLCACGSCSRSMPTYGIWDYEVLSELFPYVDFLSIHGYFGNPEKNIPNFLAVPEVLDKLIVDAIACCDAAAAKWRSATRLMIALDEWNVWYRARWISDPNTEWQVGRRLLEERYDMADVLVVGGILMTVMGHADRVKIANIAQTVNVIAPIMTEPGGPAWKQTIFHPFALMSKYGRGTSLRICQDSPTYEGTGEFKGEVSCLKAAVVHNAEAGEVVVFALNRSLTEEMQLEVELGGMTPQAILQAVEIHNDNPEAFNTADAQPVAPEDIPLSRTALADNGVKVTLKPFSFNMLRLQI